MTKGKKILIILGVVALVIALGVGLALWALQGTGSNDPQNGDTATYTIEVKSASGILLKEVGLYIYEDSSKNELVTFIKTNESGAATFTDVARKTYVAVLDKVPTGYVAEDYYPLTGELTEIVLQTGSMEDVDLDTLTYELGDAVLDFTVTGPDGKEYTLSDLFKGKKAVVLNFFYNNCQPCMLEFPFLQEAYAEYSDSIAVLAMNPVDGDNASIAALQQEMGITFPMVKCGEEWGKIMQITAYPTTVIIDRFGNICLIHTGSVPDAKTFKDAFAYFSAEDYEQALIKSIEDLKVEAPEGTKENPTEIGGEDSFEVTVEPGQEVYIELYKVIKKYLMIENENAYVIYNGETYKAKNGMVSLLVSSPDTFTSAKIAIGNSGKETQTFKVYMGALKGSFDNPYKMDLGDVAINISAGNDQGVYYTYTPTEDGTFTMQCVSATSGVKYSYFLFNTVTSAMRNLESDAQTDENGAVTVSVSAKKDQRIQICVSTLPDGSNNYPAANLKFKATFTPGEVKDQEIIQETDFTVTVLDDENQPVPNVSLSVVAKELAKPEGEQETENTQQPEQPTGFTTDKDGIASFSLLPGTYDGTMFVPDGYTAEVTTFSLSVEAPAVTLKLVKIKKADYKVTVNAPNGQPVKNVFVKLGSGSWLRTDANGVVTENLDIAAYDVTIMIPEGYDGETTYTFPEGKTELVITLKPPAGSEQNPIVVAEYPFTTEKMDGGQECYYIVPRAEGVLGVAVQDAEAYIRCGGTTYGADASGVVQYMFDPAGEEPVLLVVGNGGTTRESYTVEAVYPQGGELNPYVVNAYPYTMPAMAAGETVYVKFAYVEKVLGFTVADADILVTFGENEYAPEGGVLTYTFAEAETVLLVKNNGTEEKTFTLTAIMPELGSEENPEELSKVGSYGQLKLTSGDDDGYYMSYTSAVSGEFSIRLQQAVSVGYEIELMTANRYRCMTEDGASRKVSIPMEAGQTVMIHLYAQADAATGDIPAVTMRLTTSFVEGEVLPPETEPADPDGPSDTESTEPEPSETEPPTTETEPDAAYTYTVTVTDIFGAGQKNVGVMFMKDGAPVKVVNTNADGKAVLGVDEVATFTVELVFNDKEYYYDKAAAVMTPENRDLTIKLIANVDVNDYDPIYILNENPAYCLYVGGTRVQISTGKPNFSAEYENNCFFVFTPQEEGTYQISVTPSDMVLSYWGSTYFINKMSDSVVDNVITFSISGSSVTHTTYVFGLKATGTAVDAVVNIARIGPPEFSIADQPWTEWQSGISHTDAWKNEVGLVDHNGAYYSLSKTPTYFDIAAATGTYELWYDQANGYYRWGKNGPIVLVDLNASGRFVPLYERLYGNGQYGGSSVTGFFFDETGKFVKKEKYSDYLTQCFACVNLDANSEQGYHPLTKDLMYVLQNGFNQWWDPTSPNYLEGFADANPEYAWMFACCYVQ